MMDLDAISGPTEVRVEKDGEHRFMFDVKAFFTVTVHAKTEREARKIVDAMDGAEVVVSDELNNETHQVVLGFDGEHDLVEVDGEDPECDEIRALKITTE